MLKRTLQTMLLGLTVAFLLAASASTATAQEIYVTDTLSSFTPLAGNPTTLQQIQQKMRQGIWVLMPNGQFIFNTLADLQSGVPDKIGSYTRRGSSVDFSGMSGTFISGAQVYGKLTLNGTPSVSMDAFHIGTGAGVTVGGGLGFNSIIQYKLRATLRRIR